MNITSLTELKFNTITKKFNLFYPQIMHAGLNGLTQYEVQKGEEMRIDLVMMSVYLDSTTLKDIDVILYINGINNPLNINAGDILYFPAQESLSSYRFYFDLNDRAGQNVRKVLSVPNKTTKKDSNRKKFTDNGYFLPPVVLDESRPPVRLEDGKIVIGGLN